MKAFKSALLTLSVQEDDLTVRDLRTLLDVAEHDGSTFEQIMGRIHVNELDLLKSIRALSIPNLPNNQLIAREPSYVPDRPDVVRITAKGRMLFNVLRSMFEPESIARS